MTPHIASETLSEKFWSDGSDAQVRVLHGVAYQYSRDPKSCRPPLLAYQALSIAHVLRHKGVLPAELQTNLLKSVSKELAEADKKHVSNFSAWNEYTTLAAFVTID